MMSVQITNSFMKRWEAFPPSHPAERRVMTLCPAVLERQYARA